MDITGWLKMDTIRDMFCYVPPDTFSKRPPVASQPDESHSHEIQPDGSYSNDSHSDGIRSDEIRPKDSYSNESQSDESSYDENHPDENDADDDDANESDADGNDADESDADDNDTDESDTDDNDTDGSDADDIDASENDSEECLTISSGPEENHYHEGSADGSPPPRRRSFDMNFDQLSDESALDITEMSDDEVELEIFRRQMRALRLSKTGKRLSRRQPLIADRIRKSKFERLEIYDPVFTRVVFHNVKLARKREPVTRKRVGTPVTVSIRRTEVEINTQLFPRTCPEGYYDKIMPENNKDAATGTTNYEMSLASSEVGNPSDSSNIIHENDGGNQVSGPSDPVDNNSASEEGNVNDEDDGDVPMVDSDADPEQMADEHPPVSAKAKGKQPVRNTVDEAPTAGGEEMANVGGDVSMVDTEAEHTGDTSAGISKKAKGKQPVRNSEEASNAGVNENTIAGGNEGAGDGQGPQTNQTASGLPQNTPTPTTTTAGDIPTPKSDRSRDFNEGLRAVNGVYSPAKKRPIVMKTKDHAKGKHCCPICKAKKNNSHQLQSHFQTCVNMYGNPDALTWNEFHQYKPRSTNINKLRRDKLISAREAASAGVSTEKTSADGDTTMTDAGDEVETDDNGGEGSSGAAAATTSDDNGGEGSSAAAAAAAAPQHSAEVQHLVAQISNLSEADRRAVYNIIEDVTDWGFTFL